MNDLSLKKAIEDVFMTPEDRVVRGRLKRIKDGGTPHKVQVVTKLQYEGLEKVLDHPCVMLTNEADLMLAQYFTSHEQVMDFIDELHKASIEAFDP